MFEELVKILYDKEVNEGLNTLKGEHLKSKSNLIKTCIISDSLNMIGFGLSIDDFNKASEINRFSPKVCKSNLMFFEYDYIGGYIIGYVISNIDSKNKYSYGYVDCTGIVVIGKHKDTGKNISLLTHQDPKYLEKGENKLKFLDNLKIALSDFKILCEEGTIDMVIIGGHDQKLDTYKNMIKILGDIVYEVFGFYPVVVGGPSFSDGSKGIAEKLVHYKSVYVDTENRRVYLIKGFNNRHLNFISNQIFKVLK